MEISKRDATVILAALDKVPVVGLESQKEVFSLAVRLNQFINSNDEESSGDDVPTASE